jgi:hypothetical protein
MPIEQARTNDRYTTLTADPALRPSALLLLRFYESQVERQLDHAEAVELSGMHGVNDLVPPDLEVVATFREPSMLTVLAQGATCCYLVRIGVGAAAVTIAARTQDEAAARMSAIKSRTSGNELQRTVVSIWRSRGMTAFSDDRAIDCPAWSEIATNYSAPTRARLEALAMATPQLEGGRMILWHGPPGTGKTTAIRMLAREWSAWCSAHYIADPERFFNDPNYILDMVTRPMRYGDSPDFDGHEDAGRVRLIIGEDCDEYLTPTANRTAGAAMGRLLNLSDGILGRGLNPLILLTTNEPLSRLHPAVVRPGRCLDITEFRPLTSAESSAWLGRPSASGHTIAELYALRNSRPTSLPEPTGHGPGQYV